MAALDAPHEMPRLAAGRRRPRPTGLRPRPHEDRRDAPVREMNADARAPLEWAVAGRALSGQLESGDAGLVVALARGTLLAVIDGLGHGSEAAAAAGSAV